MKIQKYFTLTRNYLTNKIVECYELIELAYGIYTVRIIYQDGQESIEEGDLEHFNSKFEISEVNVFSTNEFRK